jgi:hypothetical protein
VVQRVLHAHRRHWHQHDGSQGVRAQLEMNAKLVSSFSCDCFNSSPPRNGNPRCALPLKTFR